MVSGVAVPVLLVGLLTLGGTLVTLGAVPRTPRAAVPACCRRRVDSFLARAPLTLLGAALSVVAGVVLVVVDLAR